MKRRPTPDRAALELERICASIGATLLEMRRVGMLCAADFDTLINWLLGLRTIEELDALLEHTGTLEDLLIFIRSLPHVKR